MKSDAECVPNTSDDKQMTYIRNHIPERPGRVVRLGKITRQAKIPEKATDVSFLVDM